MVKHSFPCPGALCLQCPEKTLFLSSSMLPPSNMGAIIFSSFLVSVWTLNKIPLVGKIIFTAPADRRAVGNNKIYALGWMLLAVCFHDIVIGSCASVGRDVDIMYYEHDRYLAPTMPMVCGYGLGIGMLHGMLEVVESEEPWVVWVRSQGKQEFEIA